PALPVPVAELELPRASRSTAALIWSGLRGLYRRTITCVLQPPARWTVRDPPLPSQAEERTYAGSHGNGSSGSPLPPAPGATRVPNSTGSARWRSRRRRGSKHLLLALHGK